MGLPFICKNIVCKDCNAPHLKDPWCGGDYTYEGKLLSFCPICGGMLPYLDTIDLPEKKPLSTSKKREIGVKIAKTHDLDYKAMYKTIKEIDGEDFVEALCFRVRLVFGVEILKDEIEKLV